jgi:hypothetical protein
VEELRQHVCRRIVLRRQLLKTDPAFQAQQLGGGSIGKIRHTHANIILKGTVQGKEEQLAREKRHKILNKIGQILLADYYENVNYEAEC